MASLVEPVSLPKRKLYGIDIDTFKSVEPWPWPDYTLDEQAMTLITGAKCKDGLVIMADHRHTDEHGNILRPIEKLQGRLDNMVFGYAGFGLKYEFFERYVLGDIAITSGTQEEYNEKNFVPKLADIVRLINRTITHPRKYTVKDKRYTLQVLIASKTDSGLHLACIKDKPLKNVAYCSIGSGEKKTDFLKTHFGINPLSMTVDDFIEFGYFSMLWHEKYFPKCGIGLEGFHPSGHYWNLDSPIDQPLEKKDLDSMKAMVEQKLEREGRLLKKVYLESLT